MGVNDKRDDPFANVSKAIAAGDDLPAGNVPETKRKAAPKPKGEWVCPVPADAPEARASHNSHGKPSASWAYRDAAGRLIHWVCRFDKPDGAKEILPQTLWREGGRLVQPPQVRMITTTAAIPSPMIWTSGDAIRC